MSFLNPIRPMGIYETLYAFQDAAGVAMGEPGTLPMSQGFPRVQQLPGGPEFPNFAGRTPEQRMYPKAWGEPGLREAIAAYYRTTYGAKITAKNVMVFAGGRPGLFALLMFLARDVRVRIASTEYTPYWDMLRLLGRRYDLVPSTESNRFMPTNDRFVGSESGRSLGLMSNPCNPTGQTRRGSVLEALVLRAADSSFGLLSDEAYEWFTEGEPVSALQFVGDINASNLFVVGATTKNYQDPGLRIGWVIAAEDSIEYLGAFSSFGMGGVSRPSQLEAIALMEPERAAHARTTVNSFYREQRARWRDSLAGLGLELFTGEGGFYHWCRLPRGMSALEFNTRLFRDKGAILPGVLCDMERGEDGYASPLKSFFRLSFGPLDPEQHDTYVEALRRALAA
ncbi:MAG: pyridoxal phosphate-dependent aminotransferase [Bdellovibrionales bacterium]|nr:pyridoxal phosphate-dependent aminotransferase [Bdellovibrionales bacterium]